MLVLAAVSLNLSKRLAQYTTRSFQFITVDSWSEALEVVVREPVEIALVDPALDGEPRAHEVERFRILFPSLPVILYTQLTPLMAPVLLRLGHADIRHVILAYHDDHPMRMRDILSQEATHAIAQCLLADLSDILVLLPRQLRWALECIIREPAEIQTVQGLAQRAGIDRRTCLRWFARANLPTPHRMLTLLRVVYAHRLLQDPGYTVDNVATKLGYQQTRSFSQNVKEVFGTTPGELRLSMSPNEALDIVRQQYLPARQDRVLNIS